MSEAVQFDLEDLTARLRAIPNYTYSAPGDLVEFTTFGTDLVPGVAGRMVSPAFDAAVDTTEMLSTPQLPPQPPPPHDPRDDLKEALRGAVQIEFATIPLYLTALWSIIDQAHPVAKSIRASRP